MDLIDRDKLLNDYYATGGTLIRAIKSAPSVSQHNSYAHFLYELEYGNVICSRCNCAYKTDTPKLVNFLYCPYCGAKITNK